MSSILRPLQLDDQPTAQTPGLARSRRLTSTQSSVPITELLSRIAWKEYLLHAPILLLGLFGYAGVIFIFGWIEPRSIQNVFFPNTYAPLLLVSAAAHFCFFSFVFLNSRRGIITSLVLTILLFLRLQQVLTVPISLWVIGIGGSVEVSYQMLRLFVRRVGPSMTIPALPVLHVLSKPKSKNSTTEAAPPPPRQRKHGRKRKHHFFGK